MPAKGSVRKRLQGKRLIRVETLAAYEKSTGRKDRKRNREIAYALFDQMGEWMGEDEEGFKMPFNMGILMVMRFTPKGKVINYRRSAQIKTTVYFHNAHSFGDRIHVTWIKPEVIRWPNMDTYTFVGETLRKREISKKCINGKVYKKIASKEQYAREMTALDNIQERYEEKLHKQKR